MVLTSLAVSSRDTANEYVYVHVCMCACVRACMRACVCACDVCNYNYTQI